MINEKIKKSFLNILSPPFLLEIWQSPNLLNVPIFNVAYRNICVNRTSTILLISNNGKHIA